MMNRIDAITELYALGREAEQLIKDIAAADDLASSYRLVGDTLAAGLCSTDSALMWRRLNQIGDLQVSIINQLAEAGEVIHL